MIILDMVWAQGSLQKKIFMQMLMLPGRHWEPDMGYHQKMWFSMAKVLVQFQLLTWHLGNNNFAEFHLLFLIITIPLQLGMKSVLLYCILP